MAQNADKALLPLAALDDTAFGCVLWTAAATAAGEHLTNNSYEYAVSVGHEHVTIQAPARSAARSAEALRIAAAEGLALVPRGDLYKGVTQFHDGRPLPYNTRNRGGVYEDV